MQVVTGISPGKETLHESHGYAGILVREPVRHGQRISRRRGNSRHCRLCPRCHRHDLPNGIVELLPHRVEAQCPVQGRSDYRSHLNARRRGRESLDIQRIFQGRQAVWNGLDLSGVEGVDIRFSLLRFRPRRYRIVPGNEGLLARHDDIISVRLRVGHGLIESD